MSESAPPRRTTRSSAKIVASTSEIASAAEQTQRASRTKRLQEKAEQLATLASLLENPKAKTENLVAFLGPKPKAEMLRNELWKPAIERWAMEGNMGPIYYYLNSVQNRFSDLVPFLDIMRDAKNGPEMLRRRKSTHSLLPLWESFREWLLSLRGNHYWNAHIDDSFAKGRVDYIKSLLRNGYPVSGRQILHHAEDVSEADLADLAKLLVQQAAKLAMQTNVDDIHQQWVFRQEHYRFWESVLKDTEPTKHRDYFLSALITQSMRLGRGSSPGNSVEPIPPLTLSLQEPDSTDLERYIQKYNLYTDPLETMLVRVFQYGFTGVSTTLMKHIDIKREENKAWLSQTLFTYITHRQGATKGPILEIILRNPAYKLNINHITIQIPEIYERYLRRMHENVLRFIMPSVLTQANQAIRTDPMVNPHSWIKEVPALALAVLYKNKKALQFFITLGADFKQCAFSVGDLTKDVEIARLFNAPQSILKIQRAYREYYYHPSHSTQRKRQEKWEADVKA
jgi:hypothetical protein